MRENQHLFCDCCNVKYFAVSAPFPGHTSAVIVTPTPLKADVVPSTGVVIASSSLSRVRPCLLWRACLTLHWTQFYVSSFSFNLCFISSHPPLSQAPGFHILPQTPKSPQLIINKEDCTGEWHTPSPYFFCCMYTNLSQVSEGTFLLSNLSYRSNNFTYAYRMWHGNIHTHCFWNVYSTSAFHNIIDLSLWVGAHWCSSLCCDGFWQLWIICVSQGMRSVAQVRGHRVGQSRSPVLSLPSAAAAQPSLRTSPTRYHQPTCLLLSLSLCAFLWLYKFSFFKQVWCWVCLP